MYCTSSPAPEVYTAIRLGLLDEAEAELLSIGALAANDARYLNLLGVICELRREWKLSRKFYGRAIRADRRFEPAQQNMRRLYELEILGSSIQPIALGDEQPNLMMLLRAREASVSSATCDRADGAIEQAAWRAGR